MQILSGITFLSIVFIASWYYTKQYIPEWNLRDFGVFRDEWPLIYKVSAAVGYVVSIGVELHTHNVYAMVLTGFLAYSLTFAGYTDAVTFKAPEEFQVFGYFLLIPGAILGLFFQIIPLKRDALEYIDNISGAINYLTSGVYPASPGLLMSLPPVVGAAIQLFALLFVITLVYVYVSGIGMADTRAFFLAAYALSWWMGMGAFLYMFYAGVILQLLMFIPATIFKWGYMRKRPKSWLNPKGKPRRATPWLPLIATGFIAGMVLLT